MRYSLIAAACGLFVAGCASMPEPFASAGPGQTPVPAMEPGPTSNVVFYDVAPPSAVPLGPIKVTLCDGNRDTMKRRIVSEAVSKGGNGITQLKCGDEGISLACWKQPTCEAVAINVPPPPPPPPPKKKRRSKRH